MLDGSLLTLFDTIYATDLVYVKDCWRLCGDAHCCSFKRHKSKFKLIAQTPCQELALLPGEFDYLEHRGWLSQFGDFDHKVIVYPLHHSTMTIDSIISYRPDCACDHDNRPTICRLYPLLPVFDDDGSMLGIDTVAIYDDIEKLQGLEPACQLAAVPFPQLQKFLTISSAIASCPIALFYLMAYRLAKQHVCSRLHSVKQTSSDDIFSVFERAFIHKSLFDHTQLRSDLSFLADRFRNRYGKLFELF